MYTQIPADLLQRQYVTLPPGQYSQLQTGQIQHQFQGQLPPQLQGQLPAHLQGQLPPGVISSRGPLPNYSNLQGAQQTMSSQQQFCPPNMMPVSPTNGNFVYTRRIIDPKNNSVVA